jgi:hypothetical protein
MKEPGVFRHKVLGFAGMSSPSPHGLGERTLPAHTQRAKRPSLEDAE